LTISPIRWGRFAHPMTTDVAVLSPGFPLIGKFWLLGPMAVTLSFNILTEEIYFRGGLTSARGTGRPRPLNRATPPDDGPKAPYGTGISNDTQKF
jgi:hypothetical protein